MTKIIFILFIAFSFVTKAQVQLVINEVSQGPAGNQEYTELLVVGTSSCSGVSTYDIRGYYIDDNNGTFAPGTGTGIADGCVQLSNDPLWSNVPAGTLILIYYDGELNPNINPANDDFSTTDGNCVLQIPYSNCTYLLNSTTQPSTATTSYPGVLAACGNWNSVIMANTHDSYQTRDNTGALIHAVSWANNNMNNIIYFAASQTGMVCAMQNSTDNNPALQANWANLTVAGGNETPGAPNNAANAAWIASMNNSCTAIAPLSAAITFTNAGCACAGSASVTASGSVGPYTYTWSPSGSHSSSISSICAGTYSVSVTSASGCVATSTVAIAGGGALSSTVSALNVNCNGASTGTASVNVAGGSGSYTYTWSPSGGNSASASGLSAGNYTVNFKDGGGCSGSNTVAITQPTVALTATAVATASVNCNGNSTGSASVIASGGTSGYTYTWSPSGGNTTSATNLSAGVYTVNITDTKGCAVSSTVSVTQPASPVSVSFTNAPTSCLGTGTVTAIGSGGISPYTYSWNTGVNTATLSGVPAGSYTVTVKDANLCAKTATVSVNANSQPTVSVNSPVICNGTVTTLTATGASTYTWSTGPTTSTISINPSANITYTVTGTAASGCTNTAVSSATVNPLPTITLSRPASICIGGSTTITATGASTYTWTQPVGGGLTATTGTAVTATPVTTGTLTYSVTATDVNSCTNTATGIVTVNALPTLTVSPSPTETICAGTLTTLTVTGASTYSWSTGAATNTVNVTGINSGTTSTTNTVSVVGTSTANCANGASYTLTVAPSPSLAITGTQTVCSGSSTILTGTGVINYTWMPGNITTNTISVNPTINTTYTLTGASGTCTATSVATVSVNASPTLAITPSSTAICAGGTSTLSATGASSYTWSSSAGGGLSATTGSSVTATPTISSGSLTYSITGTSALGCTNTATGSLNVNPKPTYTLSGSNYSICNGGSQILGVSGVTTCTWSPTTNLTGVNSFSPTVNPTVTTTYSVTGTNSFGCSNLTPAIITVSVSPTPSLSLAGGNTYSICIGSSLIFSVTPSLNTYTWTSNPSGSLNSTTIGSPTTSPTTTTIYTVSGTAAGCAASAPITATVNVNPLPTITLSRPVSICIGGSTTITATGANTYTWTQPVGGGLTATTGTAVTATPVTTGTLTYSVTATDVNSCTNTATGIVTVNALPTLTVSPSPTETICAGTVATLTVTGASTYSWSTGAATNTVNVTGINSGTTSTTNTVSVVGTSTANCANAASYTLTVAPSPSLSITGTQTVCSGSSTILTGTGAINYTWMPGNVTTNTISVNPTTNTTYTLTGASGTCTATAVATVSVNASPTLAITPSSTAICAGGTSTLSATGASSYTWSSPTGGGLSSTTGSSVTATPTVSSGSLTYSITGTSALGCTNTATGSLNVNPTPTVTIVGGTNSQTVCGGGLANYTITPITFSVSPAGSAIWTNNNTALGGPLSVSTGTGNIAGYTAPSVINQTTGVLTINAVSASGCSSTNNTNATYTLVINNIPSVNTPTINSASCGQNNGSIVGATGMGGSGNYSYSWTGGAPFLPSSLLTDSAGTYPLEIIDNVTGCIFSQNFTIANAGAPNPPAITATPTAACVGGIVTFSVTAPVAGLTYNWSTPSSGPTGTGTTFTINIPPTASTPYVVSVTSTSLTCTGRDTTISITVNQLPTPSISSPSSQICKGSSVLLSVTPTGAYTYQWSNNAGLIAGAIYDTLTVDSSSVYSVSITNTVTGCSNATNVNGTITVNNLPAIDTAGVLITQSNCTPPYNGSISNVSYTATPTAVYVWTNFNTGAVVGGNSPALSNVDAGKYCVQVTDGNGCVNKFCSININSANAPAPPGLVTTSDTVYCDGNSLQTLTVNVVNSGTVTPSVNWYGDIALADTLIKNSLTYTPSGLPVGTTTLYVNAIANGCSSAGQPITITVNPLPTVTLTAANSNAVCDGDSTILTAIGSGLSNATYAWSTGVATNSNTLTVTPSFSASPITYSVVATNTLTGCISTSAVTTITVNPTPTITVTNPNNTSNSAICLGDSVLLTANSSTGAGTTYSWTPGITLNDSTGNIVFANPTNTASPTIYTVTGTSSAGCISTPASWGIDTVSVNPLPTVNLTAANSNTVCDGNSTTLTATGTGLSNATYSWSTGVVINSNTISVSPSANLSPITYSVVATNTVTGCISVSAVTTVTVNPVPTVTVTNPNNTSNSAICLSDSVKLTANASTSLGTTYSWTPGITLNDSTGSVVMAGPTNTTSPTIYTVTATSAAGCVSTPASWGIDTVTVNPLPTVSLTAANSNTVCNGASTVLAATGNGLTNATYSWSTGSTTNSNTLTVTPAFSPETYSVIAINSITTCSSTIAMTTVTVITPTVNVSQASYDTAKCGSPGGVQGLDNTTDVFGGTQPYTFTWVNTLNGNIIATSPTFTNQPALTTCSLEVKDANGCIATVIGGSSSFTIPLAPSVTASFSAAPTSSVSIVVASYSTAAAASANPITGNVQLAVSFTNTSSVGSQYHWSFGDGDTSNLTNPTYTYTNMGTYTVTLYATSTGGCKDSAYVVVIADVPTTITIPNIFSPNGDGINDEFFIINTGLNTLTCFIYNRWGELLYTITSPNNFWDGRTPNGGNAPDGTYFYIMKAQGSDGKSYKQDGPLTLVR